MSPCLGWNDRPVTLTFAAFTIQPHPATTNNPADLTSDPAESGGLQSSSANAYNAKQPHVPEAGVAQQLEQPKSREEVSLA